MRVGEQLPTEHALCAEFAVSRETVRSALEALEQDGIIERTRGRGTFIARMPRRRPERRLTGMSEDFSGLNLDTEARVLSMGHARAPATLAELLGTGTDVMLFRLTALRVYERRPFSWNEAWMPQSLGEHMARVDFRTSTIQRELRETLKLPVWEDQQTIEAVAADIASAEVLDVPIGSPLLCMSRIYLMDGGGFALYTRSLFRPDRYYYTLKLPPPEIAAEPEAPARARRGGRGAMAASA